MGLALTFPGQGSQHIGMGRAVADAFPAAREVFAEVDDALDLHLSRLMWEGEEEDLTLTENAQPALMAVSLAIVRVLQKDAGLDIFRHVQFVAGHSLGEYSALAAAGAFSLAQTARLLRTRGLAMQAAVAVGEGGMAAILGLEYDQVQAILDAQTTSGEVCQAANDNAPGQVVISGKQAAVVAIVEKAKAAGARRAVLLPVSAPFHCTLMQPAADAMAQALENVELRAPDVPLIANVTAGPLERPDEIREKLVDQVTGMVRWRETVSYMAGQGIETLMEVGAGKVLTGLARRIDRDLEAVPVGAPEDIENVAGRFSS